MDSEKLINSFELKKNILHLIVYGTFFLQFVKNFLALLLCK